MTGGAEINFGGVLEVHLCEFERGTGAREIYLCEFEWGTAAREIYGSNKQGEDQKFQRILLPKSEIQTFFPAENRCSPKKKGLHLKNVMKSGVSPQKIRKYRKHQLGSRFALQLRQAC